MEHEDAATRVGRRHSRYLAEVSPGWEIRPIRHGLVPQRGGGARLAKSDARKDKREQAETVHVGVDQYINDGAGRPAA